MTDKPHMTLPNGDRIYEGGYGRTRDGQKVGPMFLAGREECGYPWQCKATSSYGAPCWTGGGLIGFYPNCKSDIIAAWGEQPVELPYGHARFPSGKVVDLTAITVPFGLLDAETQQALRDHGGPYEYFGAGGWDQVLDFDDGHCFVHRVKPKHPAPVVGELVMVGGKYNETLYDFESVPVSQSWHTHRLTLPTLDGQLVPGDYIGPDGHKIVVGKL